VGAFQRHIVTTGEGRRRNANVLSLFSYPETPMLKQAKAEYAKLH
jgi:hypothetical protein